MSELERRLRELGTELAYPATPRFDLGVDGRPARWVRPLALGLAVLGAALAGLLAFSPGARSAFLELFHLQGATVELVETLPPVEVQEPDLGERVSLAEAERRVGFRIVELAQAPDSIYVRGHAASLVYGDPGEPRLVLTELRGGIFGGFVKKAAGGGTTVEEVVVDGRPGLFVTGDEHFVMFLDRDGNVTDERTYLAGTVLLWNRGPLLLRLEGDLSRDEALELARGAR